MMNGKQGDHPLTDVLIDGRPVYSTEADRLVLEIAALGGREQIEDMLLLEYNEFANPDISKLEAVLTEIRDRLRQEAKERGWEVD